ncbi:MAG: LamG domain-containing protein [bacterium]|nr:LamG domain-containing protein [bacterium]
MRFDGVDDYVELNQSLRDPNTFGGTFNGKSSISLWIYPTREVGVDGETILRRIGGLHYLEYSSDVDRRLQIMVRCNPANPPCHSGGNHWPRSYAVIPRDKWTHVIFVLEPGVGWRFYIDGKLDRAESVPQVVIIDYGGPSRLGYKLTESYANFEGMMDNVRVYADALSSSQAKALYEKEKPKYILASF